MNKVIVYLITLLGLGLSVEGLENATRINCPLNAPSNLKISRKDDRLFLEWQSNAEWLCFELHKVEVFLNGVHSQRIMTMRPNFPIDLPKPCVEVRVLVSSTNDWGMESDIISASYRTETPTEFGTVENRWWMVDPTRIIVTYFPPYPYENCRFQYEMVHTFMDTDTVIFNSSTTDLIHKFDYVEAKYLCRYITMHLTPILNGIRGETWTENAVTDKFEVDIGPVSSLELEVTDELRISWTPPLYYDECAVVYTVDVINVASGQILETFRDIVTEWVFDYSSKGLYCINVAVRVTSNYRDVSGGSITRHTRLGPPLNGSC